MDSLLDHKLLIYVANKCTIKQKKHFKCYIIKQYL